MGTGIAATQQKGHTRPEKLLCIVAHADDVEFAVGGTVAKWIAAGTIVEYVIVSDGCRGTAKISGTSASAPDKISSISETRRAEQEAAARVLGVSKTTYLDFEDGHVENCHDLRCQIVNAIRESKPDAVFTIDPTFYYAPEYSYVNHKDHRAVGEAVLDAVYPLARDIDALEECHLDPHAVSTMYLWHLHSPAAQAFAIDDYIDTKIAALAEHASQGGATDEAVNAVKAFGELGALFAKTRTAEVTQQAEAENTMASESKYAELLVVVPVQ